MLVIFTTTSFLGRPSTQNSPVPAHWRESPDNSALLKIPISCLSPSKRPIGDHSRRFEAQPLQATSALQTVTGPTPITGHDRDGFWQHIHCHGHPQPCVARRGRRLFNPIESRTLHAGLLPASD
ncbi:hypothetical protein GGI35DRAFT_306508 [Trichoderma velutinum]